MADSDAPEGPRFERRVDEDGTVHYRLEAREDGDGGVAAGPPPAELAAADIDEDELAALDERMPELLEELAGERERGGAE